MIIVLIMFFYVPYKAVYLYHMVYARAIYDNENYFPVKPYQKILLYYRPKLRVDVYAQLL